MPSTLTYQSSMWKSLSRIPAASDSQTPVSAVIVTCLTSGESLVGKQPDRLTIPSINQRAGLGIIYT